VSEKVNSVTIGNTRKRRGSVVGALVVAVACLAVIPAFSGDAAEDLTAAAFVVDGDTLQIGGHVFNLQGIDAPELGQLCYQDSRWNHCGITAAFELKKLLDFDKPLRCEAAPGDPRALVCHAGSVNVAVVLLKAGYAVAASDANVAYQEAEKSAREGNLGLWHMSFASPWDWRHGRRLPGADAAAGAKPCPVRGVVEAEGRKIYYVPTDSDYKRITVDIEKGGRYFCSDAEARAAGWHRPGELTEAR
jgi:endonuclease YncB( thermonuclease family)